MIEGVTRQFDLEPPQLTAEEIAKTAELYNKGIAEVYQRFSPNDPDADYVSIEVPLTDGEEINFIVARAGIVDGFAPDQMHTWSPDDEGAIERSDGSLYETLRNMPDHERTRPQNPSSHERWRDLEERAAQQAALSTQRVDSDEIEKLFRLIMGGQVADDTEFNHWLSEDE